MSDDPKDPKEEPKHDDDQGEQKPAGYDGTTPPADTNPPPHG